MSRISDIIEKFIVDMIKESQGTVEIQRNELANQFECAPSQINYVLTTRFTSDRGYIIESRRGGGGYIRIMKANIDRNEYLKYILAERVGDSINKETAQQLVEAFYKQGIIDARIRSILNTAADDATLSIIPRPLRDRLRADMLKSLFIAAIIENKK
ncbi:MAG: CtsR family transcriptional regulator [Bacillota bacterium]